MALFFLIIVVIGFAAYIFLSGSNSKNSNDKTTPHRAHTIASVTRVGCIETPLPEYVILDLETTGLDRFEDHIVQIAAIRFIDHQEVGTFQTYIRPPCHIPERATAIHGINDRTVRNAPSIEEVKDSFISFLGDSIIGGYNVTFDIGFLSYAYGNEFSDKVKMFDVLKLTRTAIPGLVSYKLENVAPLLGYYGKSHDALSDCRAAATVLKYLCEPMEVTNNSRQILIGNHTPNIARQPEQSAHPLTQKENVSLSPFTEKRVVIAGSFDHFSRSELSQRIEKLGGIVRVNLTENVDYLLAGTESSTKVERALELQHQGSAVRIIEEPELLNMLEGCTMVVQG